MKESNNEEGDEIMKWRRRSEMKAKWKINNVKMINEVCNNEEIMK